ncbi:electron transfer flavoprotein subunit beta/FixA family protein [Okibacterium endophyticum]
MKIVVLVKEVPDTYGERRLDLETGLTVRSADGNVLDEISERAIEVALSYADTHPGTDVTLLSMAPEEAVPTIRKGLAMGATAAVLVSDDALSGADLGLTAQVLAAALERIGYDLVVAGNLSTDGSGGMIAAMVAELLGVPVASSLSTVELDDVAVTGTRDVDGGVQHLSAAYPAVISITEALPDGRFPNFKGIMAAKKKAIEVLSATDLGVVADDPAAARTIMTTVSEKPPRVAGQKIVDDGDAGAQLAEFLVQNRLV